MLSSYFIQYQFYKKEIYSIRDQWVLLCIDFSHWKIHNNIHKFTMTIKSK